jgi:hypothetical protein
MHTDHRSYARAAVIAVALVLGGCTTSHFSVSGHPSIVRALDKLVAHPQPQCSEAEVAELTLKVERRYTYYSNSRGEDEWVTLSIDRNGRCVRQLAVNR